MGKVALIFQPGQLIADGRRGNVEVVALDQPFGADRLNAARTVFVFRLTGDVLTNDQAQNELLSGG